MGLLTTGPDEVLVWPEVEVVDERRNRIPVPGDTPVAVRGRVQPVSSDDLAEQQVASIYRFVTRAFPGGPWARVSWNGRDWDVLGEPKPRRGSISTRHVTVLLKARTPMAVPNGG